MTAAAAFAPIVHHADSRAVLAGMDDNSIDAIVTDPPYALVSIVRRFGADGAAQAQAGGASGVYARASAGFMRQGWDTGETAFDPLFWAEALRVVKPGGWVAACGGTRTYHRLACAIEDGGWDIRDMGAWLYATGFPKSLDYGRDGAMSRAVGRRVARAGMEGEAGQGSALKPAHEPICLARKPFFGTLAENVAAWGVGGLNIDGCRAPTSDVVSGSGAPPMRFGGQNAKPYHDGYQPRGGNPSALGRWPANVLHDGSPEVVDSFPQSAGQMARARARTDGAAQGNRVFGALRHVHHTPEPRGDDGSAARFFFAAKPSKADRVVQCQGCGARGMGAPGCGCAKALTRSHPTVKPIALVAWLCRLIAPAGGLVLDPFAGSGTLAAAAAREGMRCVLVEREAEFVGDILHRISALDREGATA